MITWKYVPSKDGYNIKETLEWISKDSAVNGGLSPTDTLQSKCYNDVICHAGEEERPNPFIDRGNGTYADRYKPTTIKPVGFRFIPDQANASEDISGFVGINAVSDLPTEEIIRRLKTIEMLPAIYEKDGRYMPLVGSMLVTVGDKTILTREETSGGEGVLTERTRALSSTVTVKEKQRKQYVKDVLMPRKGYLDPVFTYAFRDCIKGLKEALDSVDMDNFKRVPMAPGMHHKHAYPFEHTADNTCLHGRDSEHPKDHPDIISRNWEYYLRYYYSRFEEDNIPKKHWVAKAIHRVYVDLWLPTGNSYQRGYCLALNGIRPMVYEKTGRDQIMMNSVADHKDHVRRYFRPKDLVAKYCTPQEKGSFNEIKNMDISEYNLMTDFLDYSAVDIHLLMPVFEKDIRIVEILRSASKAENPYLFDALASFLVRFATCDFVGAHPQGKSAIDFRPGKTTAEESVLPLLLATMYPQYEYLLTDYFWGWTSVESIEDFLAFKGVMYDKKDLKEIEGLNLNPAKTWVNALKALLDSKLPVRTSYINYKKIDGQENVLAYDERFGSQERANQFDKSYCFRDSWSAVSPMSFWREIVQLLKQYGRDRMTSEQLEFDTSISTRELKKPSIVVASEKLSTVLEMSIEDDPTYYPFGVKPKISQKVIGNTNLGNRLGKGTIEVIFAEGYGKWSIEDSEEYIADFCKRYNMEFEYQEKLASSIQEFGFNDTVNGAMKGLKYRRMNADMFIPISQVFTSRYFVRPIIPAAGRFEVSPDESTSKQVYDEYATRGDSVVIDEMDYKNMFIVFAKMSKTLDSKSKIISRFFSPYSTLGQALYDAEFHERTYVSEAPLYSVAEESKLQFFDYRIPYCPIGELQLKRGKYSAMDFYGASVSPVELPKYVKKLEEAGHLGRFEI